VTGYSGVNDNQEEQDDKFRQFLPELVEKLSHMSTEYVMYYYSPHSEDL